ncbi:hypothetical protein JDV02_008841 [Purpureocillium takamizusanense]|uniref:Xylanolytic transcriptional activator regulatory domain-containing protein n=1 Tax=Purpureocillium takamizusanense TaxID=2060973 RepID=A0A9Q8VFK1_9HYPO|nr:uncharacterized protein JDV02_008841 [Purpureocillium takamizusanense]UNI22999.1 hypothetical protein JDV02_008841 [Purpureocillium takamizusanense]
MDVTATDVRQGKFQDSFANDTAHGDAASAGDSVGPDLSEDTEPARLSPLTAPVVDPGLLPEPDDTDMDFYTFNSFANFLENAPLPSFYFSSLLTTEQPLPFLSPPDWGETRDELDVGCQTITYERQEGLADEPDSFSRLGSRLPSLQPEEPRPGRRHPSPCPQETDGHSHIRYPTRVPDISNSDRQLLQHAVADFSAVLRGFRLPTRLTLARYVRGYVDGFHEHLPFLHIPSMCVATCSIELILAMAAVGAQYCFEADEGLALFHAARAIATERIRRRDARVAEVGRGHGSVRSSSSNVTSSLSPDGQHDSRSNYTFNGPLGLPSEKGEHSDAASPKEHLLQSAQALLILMAMATWAKYKEILREALAIQSILASLVREDGLSLAPWDERPGSWEEWAQFESHLRTKYTVFCFFNLHCIVYDIPPLILNSELHMPLPCATALFKATTEAQWREGLKRTHQKPLDFQDSLRRLFTSNSSDTLQSHSSLGNYVLIHAIFQHIFFVRQSARCRSDSPELTAEELRPLDQVVRNWQSSWKRSPESSLNPLDPNGPVAFNSTALLRLAYIRLNMDTGPGRALGTRDPLQIAHALRDTPAIKRSPKLIRALLHSAHALSIPIRIGIRLVAKTQTFIWSIQHSLCSLECALLLSKWLEAISMLGADPSPAISDSEMRILSLVRTVLEETEFRVPTDEQLMSLSQLAKHLNVGVLRVWAAVFKGAQTWAIVEVIGDSLDMYADILETT